VSFTIHGRGPSASPLPILGLAGAGFLIPNDPFARGASRSAEPGRDSPARTVAPGGRCRHIAVRSVVPVTPSEVTRADGHPAGRDRLRHPGRYFLFVVGIMLGRSGAYTKTSEDFFLSGRLDPRLDRGLAFLSANLGAQEMIGMAASGAKYGIAPATSTGGRHPRHGLRGRLHDALLLRLARPLRARVLKLRFDEKTRAFNAISFATMTVSPPASRCSARQSCSSCCSAGTSTSRCGSRRHRPRLHLPGRAHLGDLQRGPAVLPDRLGLRPLVYLGLSNVGGWAGLKAKLQTVGDGQQPTPPTPGARPGRT